MTPSLLRLMIAAALAGTLSLCSLAIERMTGDKRIVSEGVVIGGKWWHP